ncbi:sodium:solute symporter [Marinicella litoralis]|uniref:Na+/proline symporter n=1 Tax=Marinicella litoralis TaxID=644220 RepID=A0A4R6XVB0_9GAMM|nr:sodium:solute symporter [Marinicella litoralis]TDR20388.1 Na+/proline symporter [Marinicella litoralis]
MRIEPMTLALVAGLYFAFLMLIARLTAGRASNSAFFIGNRQSPWPVVAFGMIGASLSGVTFISIPGWVAGSQFSYFQMVLGYIIGYAIVAQVLLPLYYRGGYTTIYTYLKERFGWHAHKTGSAFFILSRVVGCAFRLYLVALVLHTFILAQFGLSFWLTALISIAMIWAYTVKGGIKTIVWSDLLQTSFMIIAAAGALIFVAAHLGVTTWDGIKLMADSQYSQILFFADGWTDSKNFYKQFLSGILIVIVMTGLDQDMMQKNLSCKNLKSSQKNMYSFVLILVAVNFLFLLLGSGLYLYADAFNLALPEKSDLLFPSLALTHFPVELAIVFVLGLLASAYSSADSALTSLTTSFYLDILDKQDEDKPRLRQIIHLGFSLLVFITVVLFYYHMQTNAIDALLKAASYTYGPLLGLFAFGVLSQKTPRGRWIPLIAILAPVLSYLLANYGSAWLGGYQFGYEILLINGGLVYLGLWLISHRKISPNQSTQ